ncbi:MAG: DVUA0089 family protein [bacterium]|nr:DVUA0089 family protein [bacterium]MDP3381570.1 DVUA0089 family protein [bacterium]
MFKKILLVSLLMFTQIAQSAFLSETGSVTHTTNGLYEFSVNQPSSTVSLWETSYQDLRINLFNSQGNLVGTNDDCGWDGQAGPCYSGQNWLDASILMNLVQDNYTAVLSYWTNSSSTINGYGTNRFWGDYNLYVSGDGISAGHSSTVPEPATYLLLLLGVAGLMFVKRYPEKFGDLSNQAI